MRSWWAALAAALWVGCGSEKKQPEPVRVSAPPIVEHALQEVETWESVRVSANGQTTVIEKGPNGWRLTQPVSARADERAVHSLLRALGTPLELKDSAPTAATLKLLGLSPPRFEVTAQRSASAPVELRGGAEDAFDGTVAIQKSGSPSLFAMPGGAAQALAASTYALRDRSVLRWRGDEVVRVRVVGAAWRFTIARAAPTGWKTETGQKIDTSAMTRALSADFALRFSSFSTPPKPPSRAPVLEVTWIHRDGRETTVRAWPLPNDEWLALKVEKDESTLGTLPPRALEAWREGLGSFTPTDP